MGDRAADDLYRDPQEPPEKLPAFLKEPPKTNDPKELKRKATDDKARELKQQNDIRTILSTEPGVRFVARILGELCCIDTPAFHPQSSVMCNIAGRRQVGQQIKEMIRDTDFDLWVRVDRELENIKKPETSRRATAR
jgi:hypothetical protein